MTELMKRPTMKDDFVVKRCLELCMPRIASWLKGSDDDDEFTTRETLAKVLGPHRDGYEMARDLDRLGWSVDSHLVDILNDCADDCDSAIKELTAQWVRCYRITPAFAIGDTVLLRRKLDGHSQGVVVKIFADEARYGVRVPGQKETAWFVVPYEDVSAPVVVEQPQQTQREAIA